ncbi:MAG: hypothetical protein IKM52_05955, partial [Clostridia bacterium]|nr:hypothetical protein [Clostridia bacterium]
SDGALSPEALKNLYKENAYDIPVITDHCNPKNHSALNDENFLFLTGYEADIRPDPNGRYNIFRSENHWNRFALEPENMQNIVVILCKKMNTKSGGRRLFCRRFFWGAWRCGLVRETLFSKKVLFFSSVE